MNIAIARTPAESALVERFDTVLDQLPGAEATKQTRRDAIGAFQALGLPHRRIEEWKYTDLRQHLKAIGDVAPAGPGGAVSADDLAQALGPLAEIDADRCVLIDGHMNDALSTLEAIDGVTVLRLACQISQSAGSAEDGALAAHAVAEPVDTGVGALNSAFVTDGLLLEVGDRRGNENIKPILIVHVRTGDNYITTRNVLKFGAGVAATVIEAFVGLKNVAGGQSNAATAIEVGDGAKVTHVKVTTEAGATHTAQWSAKLGAEAQYRPFFFTADAAVTRNNLLIEFAGEGTALDASGCFLAHGDQHIDNTLWINHAVPSCESRELFKGVLDGNARGIFQGKVVVQQIAQKTDGKQMAQALMLSPTCEFDSKPELEIYADDVACGHGSTCAELDPDLVFYLRARGIPENTARALLMQSFVGEAIEQIEHEPTAAAIGKIANTWLAKLKT